MYATAEPEHVKPSHLEELSDGDLIRMVKAGDDSALGVLLRRHRDALYRFCLHLTHNRDDAEDVCQESMARAITRVDALQTGSAFRSWLFSIARNLSIDSHRYRKRVCALPDEELAPLPLPLHHESPYDRVEVHEEYQTVAQALSRLKKNHQTVLVLREVEGLSYADIAARLDLSQAAVETLLFRARKRLREEYTKSGRPVPVVAVLGALRSLLSRLSLPFGGAPLAAKLAASALLVGGAVVAVPRLAPALHVFGAGAPAATVAAHSVTRAITSPATSGSTNNGAAVGGGHRTSAARTVRGSTSRSLAHHSGRPAVAGATTGSQSHGSTSASQPRFHRISGHHPGGSASATAGKQGSAGTKSGGAASAPSGARSSSSTGTAVHTPAGSTSRQGGTSSSKPSATTASRSGGTTSGNASPATPSGSSGSGPGQPGGTSGGSGGGTNPPPSGGSSSGSSGPVGSTVNSAQQTVNNAAASAQQTVTSTTNSAQQTVNNTTNTAQQAANTAATNAQQTVNSTTSTAQKTAANAVATATNTVSKTVSKVTGGAPAPPKAPVKSPAPVPTPTLPLPKLPKP
jgi:RNA polymerase sigma factor (sigma-70 family)